MEIFLIRYISEEGYEMVRHVPFPVGEEPDKFGLGLMLHYERVSAARINPPRSSLVLIIQKLHILLKAGIPLFKSLQIIWEQGDEKTKPFLEILLSETEKGVALSTTLQHFPLSPIFIQSVRLGEEAADLKGSLGRLLQWMEQENKLRDNLITALIYPVILIGVSGLTILYLTGWVIPVFADVIKDFGRELPWVTQVVIWGSEHLVHFFAIGIILVGGTMAWVKKIGAERAHELFSEGIFKTPYFGNLVLHYSLSNFCFSVETLLEKGLPLPQAFDIGGGVIGLRSLKQKFKGVVGLLESGENFKDIFHEFPMPDMMRHLVLVGEESNQMGRMMGELGRYYQEEVLVSQKRLLTLVEPLLMVILGGVVAFLLLSMFLPILELSALDTR